MNETHANASGAAVMLSSTGRIRRARQRIWARIGFATVGVMALGGCINIAAPEDPIVIELNVNIRAEVLYRLAEDANNTIDENADIF